MKKELSTLFVLAVFIISYKINAQHSDVDVIRGNTLFENLEASYHNPIVTDKYTADPAALVHDGRVYIYAGHDQAPDDQERYIMNEWLLYSSDNMVDWKEHPVPLKPTDFDWAIHSAWAAEVVEKDGKFYWFVTVEH
ncbi:MAG: family 43 glycosylhydrolase, partial [Leeuwenhoekiella sp.]